MDMCGTHLGNNGGHGDCIAYVMHRSPGGSPRRIPRRIPLRITLEDPPGGSTPGDPPGGSLQGGNLQLYVFSLTPEKAQMQFLLSFGEPEPTCTIPRLRFLPSFICLATRTYCPLRSIGLAS